MKTLVAISILCLASCSTFEGSRGAYLQILSEAAFKAGAQAALDAMQPTKGTK